MPYNREIKYAHPFIQDKIKEILAAIQGKLPAGIIFHTPLHTLPFYGQPGGWQHLHCPPIPFRKTGNSLVMRHVVMLSLKGLIALHFCAHLKISRGLEDRDAKAIKPRNRSKETG